MSEAVFPQNPQFYVLDLVPRDITNVHSDIMT